MENIISYPTKVEKTKSKPRNTTSDGRKRVRLDVGTDPVSGKRIRKYFYGKTLKEANQKLAEYKQAMNAGMNIADQKQSLSAWIDTWLATYGQKSGYSMNYVQEMDANRLKAQLGRIKLTDVRQVNIQSFADSVSTYSKSTVNKIRITVNQIFKAAVSNRIIMFNPCEGIQWKHAGEGTHRRLDDWEVKMIMQNWKEHRTGLWVMLMLFAGLRRGEVLALQWSDIDLKKRIIHVRYGVHFEVNTPVLGAPKTASSVRDIPILPPLYNALTNTVRLSDEWVCTGAEGQPVTQSIWASSWRAWLNTMSNIMNGDTASAVSPGRRSDKDSENRPRFEIRAHDLRHTYASMLYDAGVDLKTAQKLLGHASPEITMKIYTHLSEQRQQSSIEKMIAYTSSLADDCK